MNMNSTPQAQTVKLREDIASTEVKLAEIEKGPAKNTMLAAATAARLNELHSELVDLEAREEARVESREQRSSGVRTGSLAPTMIEELSAAHIIASTPETRTPRGITSVRAALDRIEPTYRHEDGLLWADEALTCIEQGDNSRVQWEKLADNLADLLPRRGK